MKFYTFDELTYPGLPVEIGPEVRFTNRFCDPRAVTQTYQDHLDEWAICEDLGFDGAFVNEHHFTPLNIQPACNIMAAAIIMRTKTMKVGVIGNVTPLRHPIRTAEEFAMLDCLSGGRFIAGIVRGVPQEYVSYNVDPFTGRQRLKESYDIMHKCLNEEIFDYEGKFWKLTGVSIWPKPIQKPLPFWMPTGSLESVEFAAERHIAGAQVFFPPQAFKEAFDLYRDVAHARFGWEPGYDNFVGARLIHVAETNERAIEEARNAVYYFFRTLTRPVNNPAPVPGLTSDRSYQHRRHAEHDFPGPHTPFDTMRENGFIVCGDPDYVTRWLEKDMQLAGYGHFMGMFHVGDLAHELVMKSKRLFAEHVMPALQHMNVPSVQHPQAKTAATYTVREDANAATLPLYNDFNYTLARESAETRREFVEQIAGKVKAGWEMQVPEREPEGFPYEIIFAGPTTEYRGSAIRLYITTREGEAIADDAEVVLETYNPSGHDRQVVFQGRYGQFTAIPDQYEPNAALSAQRRVVAGDRYIIRLSITVPVEAPQPDPAADESFFELECFKHWLILTA
jgi:alkanesulfonate monooxygenase SsuD/methylene tetrahydromethanopterin reductase-like flavin-dependent oxidoreductase (luciferase family)